jgi:outer membrane protein assembly factor BamB
MANLSNIITPTNVLTASSTNTLSNKVISGTNNTITNVSLTTSVTGTLPVSSGGTGAATFALNNILLGNGTAALQEIAPGTSGNVLTSNGTTWSSSAIIDPAKVPTTVTANSAGPYLPGVAYSWNITNLDDYTTYTLSTTNGTITRSAATLTYTPSSSGSGGWTINGRNIAISIASIIAFISTSNVSNNVFFAGANDSNSTYNIGLWTANTNLGGTYTTVVAQYSPSGTRNWIKVFYHSTDFFRGAGVKLASDNTLFVSMSDTSNTRAYILKLDTSGNVSWSKYLASFSVEVGAVAVDTSNNVIFGGSSGGLTAIAKYNTSGTQQWQYKSSANSDYIYGITTDSSNNIFFVTGNGSDCKIVKLNSAGAVQWVTRLTNTQIYGYSIALDSAGNVYVTGQYFLSGTTYYGFVCKLNSSGTLQWQRHMLNQKFDGCAVDSSDNVYASGQDYPGGSPTGYQTVAKWNGSGTLQWQRTVYYGATNTSNNRISIAGSAFYLTNSGYASGSYILGQNKFPIDGSIPSFSIGSAAGTYAASSYTESAGSMSNPAGTLTLDASSLTETTSTPTNQALTSTINAKQAT